MLTAQCLSMFTHQPDLASHIVRFTFHISHLTLYISEPLVIRSLGHLFLCRTETSEPWVIFLLFMLFVPVHPTTLLIRTSNKNIIL